MSEMRGKERRRTLTRIAAAGGPLTVALLAFALPLRAAGVDAAAEGMRAAPSPLAARGPLAIAVAAGPGVTHLALETGFPLGAPPARDPRRSGALLEPWRLDALVSASSDRGAAGEGHGMGGALRLERLSARHAEWLGLASGGARASGDPEARLRLALGRMQALAGLRTEFAIITSSVLFRNDPRWASTRRFRYEVPSDTGPTGWRDTTETRMADHGALWSTAQASVSWQRGRLALASVAGVSLGDGVRARRWAQATIEMQASRPLRLVAALGERPSASLAFTEGAVPRAMLGVRYAPWASGGWGRVGTPSPLATAWEAKPAGRGLWLVRVHARETSRVEIAGDFTDWLPLELPALHGGWWAGLLRVQPGIHRVQLRLDGGAWQVPPGLPLADDGMAGPAGTLLLGGGE